MGRGPEVLRSKVFFLFFEGALGNIKVRAKRIPIANIGGIIILQIRHGGMKKFLSLVNTRGHLLVTLNFLRDSKS